MGNANFRHRLMVDSHSLKIKMKIKINIKIKIKRKKQYTITHIKHLHHRQETLFRLYFSGRSFLDIKSARSEKFLKTD